MFSLLKNLSFPNILGGIMGHFKTNFDLSRSRVYFHIVADIERFIALCAYITQCVIRGDNSRDVSRLMRKLCADK